MLEPRSDYGAAGSQVGLVRRQATDCTLRPSSPALRAGALVSDAPAHRLLRQTALGLGVDAFLDLQADRLEDAGQVDVVFDVIGGDILDRSAALVRAGGTLVTIVSPPTVRPRDGQAIFFVVESDRARLADLAQRVRDGRLRPIVGAARTLAEAPSAFAPARRTPGKTITRVAEGW
ncbi:hypothetical protein GCM10020216_008430 [Nonomuraea helvata]